MPNNAGGTTPDTPVLADATVSPALIALGEALLRRAGDVGGAVLRRWQVREVGKRASQEVCRDIVRTTELATVTVAHYLKTGTFPTVEQAHTLAAPGKAPLRDTISLKELTRLYLFWRDETVTAVREEASRLKSDAATVGTATAAVRIGSDSSIMRMAEQFDEERQRLESQVAEERMRLRHQALHDALTGLPNRLLFMDRLTHALDLGARRLSHCAVLFVDVDRFKDVNDIAGHSAGDDVLVTIGHRLTQVVRISDTVARLGGDEFVILCEDLIDAVAEAEALATRIASALAEPVHVGDRELLVSASVGIAVAHSNDKAEALLAQADRAMYVAKQRGRGRCETYRTDIDRGLERRTQLLASLHLARDRNELVLHYQPVTGLDSDRVTQMEALVRWEHPELGLLAPTEFIPLAEETGSIHDIGRWVFVTACADCAAWRARGDIDVGVSINISGRQLDNEHFVDVVRESLAAANLPPEAVTLELTESVLFSDLNDVHEALLELHAIGVRLAIDDFGTGYSSLSYLSKFPIDVVKIDRSFTSGLGRTTRNTTIVLATIELAHALGLTVVAEGVETEAQLAQLRRARCDAVQGFLLGRPASAAEARPDASSTAVPS